MGCYDLLVTEDLGEYELLPRSPDDLSFWILLPIPVTVIIRANHFSIRQVEHPHKLFSSRSIVPKDLLRPLNHLEDEVVHPDLVDINLALLTTILLHAFALYAYYVVVQLATQSLQPDVFVLGALNQNCLRK